MAADSPQLLEPVPKMGSWEPERAHSPCKAPRQCNAFRHEVILHGGGADGFVRHTAPLIEEALDRDAAVRVAVSRDRIAPLCEALGERAGRVGFLDMRLLGANPARIIPSWREFRDGLAPGAEPLGIGEPIWPGRRADELDECWRHEALLNLAFGTGRSWRLLCPYDLDGLEDRVIEAAHLHHPHVVDATGAYPNRSYSRRLSPFDGRLSEPPAGAGELEFREGDLGEIRRVLTCWARDEGLEREATSDLVLAVDEIATNSIRHGGGAGRLQMWHEGDTLLCEVRDLGEIRDPLLGRVRPGSGSNCGRGMWIANQLCDLVQIRSSRGGSQIRLHKRLA
jgi:anti-sigma regulatory factor (Ser/Thr protein kinase)